MLSSLDPLSKEAQESKIGIHRLMKMQAYLQPYSLQAVEGLEILKKLTTVILEKELFMLLDVPNTQSLAIYTVPANERSEAQTVTSAFSSAAYPSTPADGSAIAIDGLEQSDDVAEGHARETIIRTSKANSSSSQQVSDPRRTEPVAGTNFVSQSSLDYEPSKSLEASSDCASDV